MLSANLAGSQVLSLTLNTLYYPVPFFLEHFYAEYRIAEGRKVLGAVEFLGLLFQLRPWDSDRERERQFGAESRRRCR